MPTGGSCIRTAGPTPRRSGARLVAVTGVNYQVADVRQRLQHPLDLHKPHDVRQLSGVSNPASEA